MKTVSISLDDETWEAATHAAEARHTTVDALVAHLLKNVVTPEPNSGGAERDARERKELVRALAACKAEVGEQPTRERTYSDRRFHRH
jgi:hypothetical protein